MTNQELEERGHEVIALLKSGSFDQLSTIYEYALRFDREASNAIKTDFESALEEAAGSISEAKHKISIKHFETNDTGLKSLIECDLQMEHSTGILVELILSINGSIYLEDISSYRGELNA